MVTNNSLTANDSSFSAHPLSRFSHFELFARLFEVARSSHSLGYEKKKELRPVHQVENPDITVGAVLLTYQPNPLFASYESL